jgi:hypothetical protein
MIKQIINEKFKHFLNLFFSQMLNMAKSNAINTQIKTQINFGYFSLEIINQFPTIKYVFLFRRYF